MTPERPRPINDDHGDQFPGALPARATTTRPDGVGERLVRMRSAYAQKVDSAVQAAREDLAHERRPVRTRGGRPRGQASTTLRRLGRLTRRSLDRFDRYALDVFNPDASHRPNADR